MMHTNFPDDSIWQMAEAGRQHGGSSSDTANKSWLLMQLERARSSGESGESCAAVLSVSVGEMRECELARALSRQISQRLANCAGANAVAVLGNAEFAVLLDNLDEHYIQAAVQANAMAQRILAEFQQPFRLIDGELICSPGIGICIIDRAPVPASVILGNARFAMYRAIAAGKNAIRFYDPALEQALNMHEELKAGLDSNQFELEYETQPAGSLGTGRFEASLRWRHPQYGALSHGELLALAESAGMGHALGEWLLTQVCLRLGRWRREIATGCHAVVVAVDAIQFRRDDFVARLVSMLENAGAGFHQLKLLLDENAWSDDGAVERIADLKNLGIDVLSCR